MGSQSSGSKWVAGLLIVAILVVVGIFIFREKQARDAVTAPAFSTAPAASASSTTVHDAPLVQHPIDPVSGSTAALPALDQSDDDVLAGLMALTSDGALKTLLRPEAIVSRMVSTIDALPKQSVGMNVVPLRTPTGRFQVVSDDGNFVASKKNVERYATYMYVADRMNAKAAAAWYKRNYPLFQQAYRDLGTNGYFNDRLIEVIDHLLAAPEPKGNQQLLPEKVGYVYANQTLEQLSVGQKFMIRIGPENEAKLKAKLRALREEIVADKAAMPTGE
ncbi:hypothetical protein BJI69_01050 [Luteibacter rhizovicinus DSM 16549]|uniref:DUF3014 domain-containing protein n=1 Tax=Luteibacter rhizovicinus DSM 16549 TaxID=1440763 RepID=A0A1L3ENM9_9GAMM|nr:DUF3014 domain-containing protein [Luteibacter rhizovicinus]APG02630.1 hypothetical protein BJI69_01050 [Luteibacter rhizovicinus DSM 16549]